MREGNQRVLAMDTYTAEGHHHHHNHNPITQLQAKYKELEIGFKDWLSIVSTSAIEGAVIGALIVIDFLSFASNSALQEVKIPPGPRLLILDHIQREAELNKGKGGRST
ncbi:hypothetical protein L1987_24708 [Smallanthus sonchifolius]|uniref:Uncharacterized protein n=2 Tax=Smallanthus sonchifolius TaxID=185202 RepID=A0ACB9IKZ0_9ASTR|nr:hypothetical protein L1987_24706 [Smallanthus sonchifolius]KAI3808747.1 hypothetical protein L1987_24708 [Smallanthus sonchifolius]